MRKAPIKIQKGLICCYIDDKSQAILIVPQTDYINVYRKNKIAFYKIQIYFLLPLKISIFALQLTKKG